MERRAAAMDERVAASLLAVQCSLEAQETPAGGAQVAARASRARRRLSTSDSSSDSSVAGGIDRESPLNTAAFVVVAQPRRERCCVMRVLPRFSRWISFGRVG